MIKEKKEKIDQQNCRIMTIIPGDLGTQLYQTELQIALVEHEENIIKDIEEAYRRIENGKVWKLRAMWGKYF